MRRDEANDSHLLSVPHRLDDAARQAEIDLERAEEVVGRLALAQATRDVLALLPDAVEVHFEPAAGHDGDPVCVFRIEDAKRKGLYVIGDPDGADERRALREGLGSIELLVTRAFELLGADYFGVLPNASPFGMFSRNSYAFRVVR